MQAPHVNWLDSLRVEFDRPLDRTLLQHALVVLDPLGGVVEGHVAIGKGELTWSFTPHSDWRAEHYRLSVDPRMEDLAGDSLTRVFDRDLTRPDNAPLTLERAMIKFRPE